MFFFVNQIFLICSLSLAMKKSRTIIEEFGHFDFFYQIFNCNFFFAFLILLRQTQIFKKMAFSPNKTIEPIIESQKNELCFGRVQLSIVRAKFGVSESISTKKIQIKLKFNVMLGFSMKNHPVCITSR